MLYRACLFIRPEPQCTRRSRAGRTGCPTRRALATVRCIFRHNACAHAHTLPVGRVAYSASQLEPRAMPCAWLRSPRCPLLRAKGHALGRRPVLGHPRCWRRRGKMPNDIFRRWLVRHNACRRPSRSASLALHPRALLLGGWPLFPTAELG
jgi:hypothetical protein